MKPLANQNSKAIRGIIWLLIYGLALTPIFTGLAPTRSADAASEAELVQQGIDLYEKNKLDQALQTLESAEIIYPENPAVPYYLGLIYLQKKQRTTAIAQWKRYVELAPQNANTDTIHKNITLLLHKESEEYARKAVSEEAAMLKEPVDENTVAVTAFKNMGSEDLGPLGKGMAAMVIADLSAFKTLKVVEREKLQALLTEMKLGSSGLVDEKSAPKVGRLLRAKYVTSGSLTDLEKESLQIASILMDADLKTTMGTQDTQGSLKKFYDLEKEIACRIAADLGRDCKKAPEAFEKIHTKSLPALVAYSYGLDYADEEKYDEARNMFQKALEEDPDFDLAQAALLATPFAAMLMLSESQIIGNAAAAAPPASGTTATSAAATSTAGSGGGLGIGTTAAIAGGAVLTVGAAAAVVAMASDEESPSPPTAPSLAGLWSGTWYDNVGGEGTLALELTQNGSSIGGRVRFTDTDCISEGTLSGSFSGSDVQFTVSSADAGATLNANVDFGSNRLDGTLEFTSGACSGTTMNFSTMQTGAADVEW